MDRECVVINAGNDREGFLALRKTHIGSSEIACIVGMNKWKSKYQLWLEKTGRAAPDAENMAMEVGSLMEPVVAELYRKHYLAGAKEEAGYKMFKCQDTFALKEPFAFASATPDYRVVEPDGEEEIIEIKTTSEYNKQAWENGVPDHIHCQIIWQMGVTGIHKAKAVVLIGNRDLRVFDVEWSEELFEQLLSHAVAFWQMVESDVAPSTDEVLPDVAKEEFTEEETVNEELEAIIIDYMAAKAEKTIHDKTGKDLEAKVKGLKAKVLLNMGRFGKVISGQYVAMKKKIVREPYTVKGSTYTDLVIKGE